MIFRLDFWTVLTVWYFLFVILWHTCSTKKLRWLFCMAVLFVLFVFIYVHVYWCPTRFPCQMMFVSFNSNTTGVTSRTRFVNISFIQLYIYIYTKCLRCENKPFLKEKNPSAINNYSWILTDVFLIGLLKLHGPDIPFHMLRYIYILE